MYGLCLVYLYVECDKIEHLRQESISNGAVADKYIIKVALMEEITCLWPGGCDCSHKPLQRGGILDWHCHTAAHEKKKVYLTQYPCHFTGQMIYLDTS